MGVCAENNYLNGFQVIDSAKMKEYHNLGYELLPCDDCYIFLALESVMITLSIYFSTGKGVAALVRGVLTPDGVALWLASLCFAHRSGRGTKIIRVLVPIPM